MSEAEIDQVRKAVSEVKREGLKAGLVHASIEASILLIGLVVVFSKADIGFIPSGDIVVSGTSVSKASLIAVGVAFVVFVVDVAWIYRRSTIKKFEEFNPEVQEVLRTARDAAEHDVDNEIATRLYEDTIDRLKETTSAGFISFKRIGGLFLVLLIIGLLFAYFSMVGFNFMPGDGFSLQGAGIGPGQGASGSQGQGSGAGAGGEEKYEGLQNGKQILGSAGNVSNGTQAKSVNLEQSGAVSGSGGGGGAGGLSSSGSGGSAPSGVDIDVDRADFGSQNQVDREEAQLMREYYKQRNK